MLKFINLLLIGILSIPIFAYDRAKIPSYDTTYYEKGNKYRQIYIDEGKYEIYILIRNDTIILNDREKTTTTYHRVNEKTK